MTDISEAEFADTVLVPVLRALHEQTDVTVEAEVWVEDPDGYVDVVVYFPTHTLAVKVTNDPATRANAPQAVEYASQAVEDASHFDGNVPVVAAPADHFATAQVPIWKGRGVVVWAVDTETGALTVVGEGNDGPR